MALAINCTCHTHGLMAREDALKCLEHVFCLTDSFGSGCRVRWLHPSKLSYVNLLGDRLVKDNFLSIRSIDLSDKFSPLRKSVRIQQPLTRHTAN
jgi:hypothetical protein